MIHLRFSSRTPPTRALALAVSCLALAMSAGACSTAAAPPSPPALDRPERLTFFCWDDERDEVVELERCEPDPDSTRFKMHGVVTQTTTGEVAAIQIVGDDDSPAGVIDTDRRVPGFTFAAVGDVPSAVVTPRSNPAFTYVVNRGSSELHVIETGSFRTGLGADVTEVLGPDGGSFFPVGARPTDMVLTPDERELVVTLPEIGEIWFVPVDGATVGAPVVVPLLGELSDPVDLTAPGVSQPPQYQYECGYEDGIDPLVPAPPRAPFARDAVPRPWGIAVDAEAGRVLVADRGLPVIHVLDVATRSEITTINVSVPTRDVVLTPRVPAAPGGTERTERYLYAIDDLDHSVLAVDYTDPARSSFGAVLTVSPTAPRDRLEVPLPARAIEMATPRYTTIGDLAYCTTAEESSPVELHGVFLVVGTTDGLVRVFDVFDLDTPCRGVGCATVTPDAADTRVAIGRHRPRIGSFIGSGVSLDPAPTWRLGNQSGGVADDGTAGDQPSLSPIECPDGLDPVFPSGGAPLVCTVTDPWATAAQIFRATYEGTIPFTATTGGNFGDTPGVIEVGFDPCSRGILGAGGVPAAGYLAGYAGDVVAITSPIPPSVTDEDLLQRCQQLVRVGDSDETTPVLLPLLDASNDPEGGTYPGRLFVGDPINVDATLDEVRQCFPELLELEVRVREAYLVESTRSGFRHAVVTGEGGRCEVDPAQRDALERGRAFPGQPFQTPEIAFQIAEPPLADRPTLELTVGNVPVRLGYDVTNDGQSDFPSLITGLEYNDVDERLYVVEQARQGVVRMNLMSTQPIEVVFR